MRLQKKTPQNYGGMSVEEFGKWIIDLGDGKLTTYSLENESDPTWIKVPIEFLIQHANRHYFYNVAMIMQEHPPSLNPTPTLLGARKEYREAHPHKIDILRYYCRKKDGNLSKSDCLKEGKKEPKNVNAKLSSNRCTIEAKQMETEWTKLSEIKADRDDWTIKVRVMRIWDGVNPSTKEIYNSNMILLDEERNLQHVLLRNNQRRTFLPQFKEGNIYMISNFKITDAKGTYRPLPKQDTIITLFHATKVQRLKQDLKSMP
ncbi:hypothetical protein RJ639_040684 [Escallonia herrerae]|uniref:Replication protein A 70 kDa DNA-binding subunit B/D first OB fold domain-containing protein n=1 Tax=Escallonia herrerae TaxID=1293975 RepID=A0AA89B6S5_9ASTE|nr:hypothetical protein RJ639_040684 [Escallonia herrerae]